MYKRLLSVFLSVLLVLVLPVTSFAAGGGFNQGEYDKLKTYEAKSAYLVEVDKYYASKNYNVSADEFAAYTAACAELSRSASKAEAAAAAAVLPEDAAAIIARIKETYGITVELGYNGSYDKGAKVTQHLQGIESGLSYLGSNFVKKIIKSVEDAQGIPFEFQLVPRLDVKKASGALETSWAIANVGGIAVYGYNSFPISAKAIIHEFGHLLERAVRTSTGTAPAPFGNTAGIEYGYTANSIKYVKSVASDKFVSTYAASNAAEDYAECFAVSILGGTKTPLTYGKTTVIYKKVRVVYDDLVNFAGADSRATQRVGGYLGL